MKRVHGSKAAVATLAALVALVAQAETTAITGATVHTVGPDKTIRNATIVMEDGRIAAVGAGLAVPDGATSVDAGGKAVTPGLMTPIGQIGLVEVSGVPETVDFIQRGDRFTASFDVAEAYNPRSTLVAINRIAGITYAVLSPESMAEPDVLGYQSRVLSGLVSVVHLGDDGVFLERGVGIYAHLGEAGSGVAAGSRAAALMTLRAALEDARDYAGHRAAFDERRRRDYSISRPDLEVLQPVLSGERRLLVDVHRASDISAALQLAAEFELELVIVGGAEAWMVAEALEAAGVPVILDAMTNLPQGFDRLNARLDSAALLSRAGVRFAIGGDSANQNYNARNVTQAAGIAVANGLSWDEALAAITLAPARIYDLDADIGSIEAGKRADLVIWSGDPLELRTTAEQVFIGGRPVDMKSRQTLLRDRYLPDNAEKPPAFR
jgi:imidazolonepropionase-like amidohydrolase